MDEIKGNGANTPVHSLPVKTGLAIAFMLGLIPRLIQFFAEPTMWKDELFSVVNIENMSIWELLTQQPEYNQVAPAGFYMIQKFFYTLFGSTEMAFRFYPFLSSLIALWLFYLIARKFLTGTKLVLAVLFMATAIGPLWQSFNAKPYSGDIMFLMFFVWIGLTVLERKLSRWEVCGYAIVGFVGASSSFPASVFVLALMAVFILKRKELPSRSYTPIFILWMAGALWNILYAQFIISPDVAIAMAEHHSKRFPPSDVFGYLLFFPKQLTVNFIDFLIVVSSSNPVMVIRSVVVFLLSAVTIYPMIKTRRMDLLILILPFVMMIGLVVFHILPMMGRTSYYGLWPLLLLSLAGLGFLQNHIRWVKPWLTNTIAVILVFPSVLIVMLGINSLPVSAEPVKKMLNYYVEKKKTGDVLYVQGSGALYMEYYGRKMGVDDYVLGEYEYDISAEEYARDLQQLKGNKRVWFLFTGYRPEMNPELSRDEIEGIFIREAGLIDAHPFKSAGYPNFLNLYDFSKNAH